MIFFNWKICKSLIDLNGNSDTYVISGDRKLAKQNSKTLPEICTDDFCEGHIEAFSVLDNFAGFTKNVKQAIAFFNMLQIHMLQSNWYNWIFRQIKNFVTLTISEKWWNKQGNWSGFCRKKITLSTDRCSELVKI